MGTQRESRVKDARIVLRVTGVDKRTIERLSGEAGVSVTEWIMARCWGEVPEKRADGRSFPQPSALATQVERVYVAPGDSLAALKAKGLIKTGAELFVSGLATPPVEVTKRPGRQMCAEDGSDLPSRLFPDRPFSLRNCQQVWVMPGYDIGVMQDKDTLRFWPVVGSMEQSAKSLATLDEARELAEASVESVGGSSW